MSLSLSSSAPSAPAVEPAPAPSSVVSVGPPGGLALPEQQQQQQQLPPQQQQQQQQEVVGENKEQNSGVLDLVFLVDATSSMGSYIQAAKASICKIVETIVSSEKTDVQFALVAYRDHPPQDRTFITKVYPFTDSLKAMHKNVGELQPQGGGDGPEAVTAGMQAVLKLDYRKNSTKVCVIIADAPPHGLGENGDGFPNGDPDGLDPIQLAREMLERGIVLYTVACEPALSSYKFATDFFQGIAKITKGQFLPLSGAGLLADVIIGGAKEQISMEKLMEEVDREAARVKAANVHLDEAGVKREVAKNLRAKGVKAKQVSVDELYESNKQAEKNVSKFVECASLSAWSRSADVRPAARQIKSGMLPDRPMPSAMSRPMMPVGAVRSATSSSARTSLSLSRPGSSRSSLSAMAVPMSAVSASPSLAPPSAPSGAFAAPAPAPKMAMQQVYMSEDTVSEEQVERMYDMYNARKKK